MENIATLIKDARSILVLTGAGISAASGIPTFRGEEGYWTKGSTNYFPEQMATNRFFREDPNTLFEWYNYRQDICAKAEPNPGHHIIRKLEQWCVEQDKEFLLVTQNVDNLHRVAGSESIIEIHGNIFKYRCSSPFSDHAKELLDIAGDFEKRNDIPLCPKCDAYLRPHVLWFDESYDNELFGFAISINAAEKADVLLVVGTALMTTLPVYVVRTVYQKQGTIVEVNPDPVLEGQIPDEMVFSLGSSEFFEKLSAELGIE